jgi:hypothetical protein
MASPIHRMDAPNAGLHSLESMKYLVERMDLTDREGSLNWNRVPAPRLHGEVHGNDPQGILAALVAHEGAVQVGVTAVFADGQAVMVAQQGEVMYALRAVPGGVRENGRIVLAPVQRKHGRSR